MFVKVVRKNDVKSFETTYHCDMASFYREEGKLIVESFDGKFLEISLYQPPVEQGQENWQTVIYYMNDQGKTFDTFWMNYK